MSQLVPLIKVQLLSHRFITVTCCFNREPLTCFVSGWTQRHIQEAQLSPSDRAMRLVSSNLANLHATVQKLIMRQVLAKSMV